MCSRTSRLAPQDIALGGHVARCENENCGYTQIAYNSCLDIPPGAQAWVVVQIMYRVTNGGESRRRKNQLSVVCRLRAVARHDGNGSWAEVARMSAGVRSSFDSSVRGDAATRPTLTYGRSAMLACSATTLRAGDIGLLSWGSRLTSRSLTGSEPRSLRIGKTLDSTRSMTPGRFRSNQAN